MAKSTNIRWMIRRDMSDVYAIDQHCTAPWKEVDFTDALSQRETIGMVIESGDEILGYMVYQLGEKQIMLVRIGVRKDHRRAGLGRLMIEKIKSKLSPAKRDTLAAVVRERHLDLQLFLRGCGLTCCLVEKGHFCKPEEDGYRMEYCKGEE